MACAKAPLRHPGIGQTITIETIQKTQDMKGKEPTIFNLQGATARDSYQCPRCGDGGAPPRSALGTTKPGAAAGEWRSAFQHDTASPSAALPLNAEQPKVSKPIDKCVLIADDDSLVRCSLAAVLEFEGYVVDEARNGVEAVTRAIENQPDLVLLDLNMPRWDGWTALSQLDRVTPVLPVIVITARPNQYEKAVRLGVDAFMEKPLDIPLLVRAVKRLTREDEKRHVRRVTNRAFVTQLLDSAGQ